MMLLQQINGEGRQMKSRVVIALPLILVLLSACSGSKSEPVSNQAVSSSAVPAEYAKGEAAFNTHCARCHGPKAAGTNNGPTFINRVYEPDHHGDAAFRLAPRNGVRAHHWQFGDMPKIEGVTSQEVDEIILYIRWLQRQAGIQ
jgi:mono/diheme cytochrome c family protein